MSGPGREQLAAALARAREFVAARGGELDRLRCAVLLGERPPAAARRALAALQAADGSFAPLPGAPAGGSAGSVEACLAALEALDALGVRHGPLVERGMAWLVGRQAPDGSFGDAPGPAEEARLAATGRAGTLLARSPYAPPAALAAAGDYLAARFAPERVAGNAERLAAFAGFFSNAGHSRADEVLQWCGRELERGFRSGALGAVGAARVLLRCDALGLPGARLAAGEIAAALLAEQGADGGFGDVAATLDAALGLVRFVPR